MNQEKAFSRKERQERKGESTSYQALAFLPVGLSLCLYKYLNSFAAFARE